MALKQIENAVAQLEEDIVELKGHFATWDSQSKLGSNKYRPLARRVVLSAQRIEQLVRENTY